MLENQIGNPCPMTTGRLIEEALAGAKAHGRDDLAEIAEALVGMHGTAVAARAEMRADCDARIRDFARHVRHEQAERETTFDVLDASARGAADRILDMLAAD